MSPSEILVAVPSLRFDGERLRWSGKIPAAVVAAIVPASVVDRLAPVVMTMLA